MDRSEVIKYKDSLLNNLRLRGEYDTASGLRKKVFLVEGATDKKFIDHVIDSNIRCLPVVDFMRARSAFSTSPLASSMQYNSKVVIITILKHIAYFPEYYDFPKGAEKWPLYGFVDKDFDNSNDYSRVTKLFFTDTHDLETLMMSTDSEILSRLEDCSITEDEVRAALYIASQMAAYRKAISDNGTLNIALINAPDGTIEFNAFTEGDKVNMVKLLEYINNRMKKSLSREKLKKTREAILKSLKKKLDKEGFWKKTLESFDVRIESDFWMNVNGHDILSAICYKNPEVRKAFPNQGMYSQNRDFEFALSEVYNYECLKNTDLYTKLQEADLLKG